MNLGVDIAGANLLVWDDHGQFFLHHLSINLSQLSEGADALSHFSNRFASLLGPLGLVRFVQVVHAYPDLKPTGQQVKKHHPEKYDEHAQILLQDDDVRGDHPPALL